MEWREYDEEGKCKICGRVIKDSFTPSKKISYDDYGIDDVFDEADDSFENSN
jgi:hypothetical protein